MTTKTTSFNVSKFLAAARDVREAALDMLANPLVGDIRTAYRMVLDESDYIVSTYVDTRTAVDLDAELSTAAGAAGQFGASRAQIDRIVSLCAARGEFERLGYSRLTVRQASNLIADLAA